MKQLTFGTVLLVAVTTVLSIQVAAQDRPGWNAYWQTIGATGTPDESAASRILLQDSGWAEIKHEISSTTVRLRYDIPSLEGLSAPGDYDFTWAFRMWVRVRDNGPSARALVSIKSLSKSSSGTVRTLGRFDSDQHTCESCSADPPDATGAFWALGPYLFDESGIVTWFKPAFNVYWAEVQLIKTAIDGRPGIHAVGVNIGDF